MSSPAHPALRSPGAPLPETGARGRSASAVLRVACSGEGFARARVFARDTLRRWSLGHRGDDAVLVLTELVSNAVTHAVPSAAPGAPDVRLGLALDPGHLTLTVSDPGAAAPVLRTSPGPSALHEHGRGLRIVDALAQEWGWTPHPPAGKTVWATLSTDPLT